MCPNAKLLMNIIRFPGSTGLTRQLSLRRILTVPKKPPRGLSKVASNSFQCLPNPYPVSGYATHDFHKTPAQHEFIQVEETPNPNSLKFYPGEVVIKSGAANFQDKVQGSLKSPLAKALFRIKGVKSVFFAQDFIAVSKEDDEKIEWNALKPQISSAIMMFYTMKHPILSSPIDSDLNRVNGSDSEMVKKTETLISERIRPTKQKDGADLEFVSFKNNIERSRLQGARPSRPNSPVKVLTLPNLLTTTRIVLTPAIGYFIWNGLNSYALYCFTAAAVTDLLDGYLARRLNQCSQLGAILDPVADKLLMTTSFVALYHVGMLPAWLVGGFIGRDLALLSGGLSVRYLSFQGARPKIKHFMDFNRYPMPAFKPTLMSKCNTALQCYLIFIHLDICQMIGVQLSQSDVLALHITTACTTAISFGQYLARQIFEDKPTRYLI